MGAINFKTSDYITMCIKPYETSEILTDPDFIDYCQEERPGEDPEEIAADEITGYYEADEENYTAIAKKYDFYYFHIVLEPGYYESLYIDIEANFCIYDDAAEKREALKEATKVKEFLTECAGVGFVACAPGWCTKYYTYAETLEKIKAAIKEMKEEIKAAPTWYTYNRRTA